ncbi:phosphodiester glycosidase family protein [Nonomuraea sp. SBT364]|uniref:phosphodiester glycosidase family protein n=1 Tax=Nonomuraea sp. SBT364 TaxID=1580530 RepID=UPI0009EA5F20
MNLDGGGSSVMMTSGAIVNRPSDAAGQWARAWCGSRRRRADAGRAESRRS